MNSGRNHSQTVEFEEKNSGLFYVGLTINMKSITIARFNIEHTYVTLANSLHVVSRYFCRFFEFTFSIDLKEKNTKPEI